MKQLSISKLGLGFLILTLCSMPFPATSADVCPGLKQTLTPLGYQQLAVSNTAVGFTLPATSRPVRVAIVMVEANPIRYRDDGTNPTATVGTLINPNVSVVVCGAAINRFRAIRSGSDAVLSINYYGD